MYIAIPAYASLFVSAQLTAHFLAGYPGTHGTTEGKVEGCMQHLAASVRK